MGAKGKTLDLEHRVYGVIKCPRCEEYSGLTEWDSCTHDKCITREMRRAYVSLEEVKAYAKHDNKMYYCCPKCGEFTIGSKLRVEIET